MSALTALTAEPDLELITTKEGRFQPWKPLASRYRRKKLLPSVWWSRGVRYARVEEPDFVKAWLCGECQQLVQLYNERPSNAQKHMEWKHGWKGDDISLSASEGSAASSSTKPMSQASSSSSQPTLVNMLQGFEPNASQWRANSLQWLLETHQPLSTIEHPAFRRMLTGITPRMTKYLYGRNTARSWIGDEFDLARNKVKLLLKQALS